MDLRDGKEEKKKEQSKNNQRTIKVQSKYNQRTIKVQSKNNQSTIKEQSKTINSRYSLVVTQPTTNQPAHGLSTAERTGSPVVSMSCGRLRKNMGWMK
jgi:hypothetical protein